jgi:hypothetical protein
MSRDRRRYVRSANEAMNQLAYALVRLLVMAGVGHRREAHDTREPGA